ncbi:MAG: hypothetical protein H7X70_07190 [Candidatus Kapabacteria bacterium]|nr:hypothetical protein [Candidatus Kapabacteria bacterium]
MRMWNSVLVSLLMVTFVSAQTDPAPVDRTPVIPFNIKLLSPRTRVEALLKERNFVVRQVPPVEGVNPGIYSTNIEWNGIAFDTLFVWFSASSSRVSAISLARTCDSDKVPLVVAELTDAVSHSYGDPTFSDEGMARWERGDEAAISMGPYAENDAVWLRFDLAPLFFRLPTTKPVWPLALPLATDRDEIRDIMIDSCRKVNEDGDMVITSLGCSCYGAKARKTTVYIDALGRPTTIEMVINRADQGAVQARIQSLLGAPNGPDPSIPTWLVEESPAVSIADSDEGLMVTFNIAAMELLQYMDR